MRSLAGTRGYSYYPSFPSLMKSGFLHSPASLWLAGANDSELVVSILVSTRHGIIDARSVHNRVDMRLTTGDGGGLRYADQGSHSPVQSLHRSKCL